jgi:hypothetical protein
LDGRLAAARCNGTPSVTERVIHAIAQVLDIGIAVVRKFGEQLFRAVDQFVQFTVSFHGGFLCDYVKRGRPLMGARHCINRRARHDVTGTRERA